MASFSSSFGTLNLSDFGDGDTLDISKPDSTHVRFTLGTALGDVWSGVDGSPNGVTGAGLNVLTLDTTNFAGTLVEVYSGPAETVTVHGPTDTSLYPFSLTLVTRNDIRFAGSVSNFDGFVALNAQQGDIVIDGPLLTRGDMQIIAGDFASTGGTITVNADLRTTSQFPSSSEISLKARGDVIVNSTIATGDVSAFNDVDTVTSGIIVIQSTAGSLLGNASGHLSTGDVNGNDRSSSGFVNINVVGEVRMTGNNAIMTGSGEAGGKANTGDISIYDATRVSSDGGTGKLSLSVGGNVDEYSWGVLKLGSSGAKIKSDVFITSPNPLFVGFIETDLLTTQTVFIESTSGDLVLQNVGTSAPLNRALEGDNVTFRSATGTLRWPSLHSSYPFRIGDGRLTLEADEIDLTTNRTIGGPPRPEPGAITGTGSLVLRPSNAATNIQLGGTNETAALDLTLEDLQTFQGLGPIEFGTWNSVTIGRAEDATGTLALLDHTSVSGGDPPGRNYSLHAGEFESKICSILGETCSLAGDILLLQARTGAIGTALLPIPVFARDKLSLVTLAPDGSGDIFATTTNDLVLGDDTFINTGAGEDEVRLKTTGSIAVETIVTLNDALSLEAGDNVEVRNGSTLRSATLNVLAQSIHTNQTGELQTLVGDMLLHATDGPIGLRFTPPLPDGTDLQSVNVQVAGRLSLVTDAPGGAAGDISVSSSGTLAVSTIHSGPDPDVVSISSGQNVILTDNVTVNDAIGITAGGNVNLQIPGAFEAQSINVNATGNIQGNGDLKSTAVVGIVLISVNGGVGANGVPVEVLLENGGKLVTSSSGDQYVATSGVVAVETLDAGTGTVTIVNGTFQLTSDDSIADTSSIAIVTNATLDVGTANEIVQKMTIDGGLIIENGGTITATSGTVLISGTVSGISGAQGVVKTGDGTVVVTGVNDYTGPTVIQFGDVAIDTTGAITESEITVEDQGILSGGNADPTVTEGGVVNLVIVEDGGTVAPGASPSILRTGDLTFNSGGNYAVDIFGAMPGAGYDQLRVTGTVTINNANLLLDFGSFAAAVGSVFTIIDNDGVDPVVGQFNGFPQGATRFVEGHFLQVSYTQGDGNDVVVAIVPVEYDFGDASATYPTTLAQDGARHALSGLLLGTQWDAEADGQPSATATDDDTMNSPDDEDGVVISGNFTLLAGGGGTATVTVNGGGGDARLYGWIDFNGDGDWSDIGEQIFDGTTTIADGNSTLAFSVPLTSTAGQTFARFRLSTDTALNFDGSATDGEVEDYQITIQANQAPIADMGYPYTVIQGRDLVLDGSASSDPDAALGDSIVSYAWDVNNDGVYDAAGVNPTITAAGLASLGLSPGRHTIGLRVTDSLGRSGPDATFLYLLAVDFGDAPDRYRTLEASGGPRHGISSSLYLGSTVTDADSDGFGDGVDDLGNASDDDVEGAPPDDENGVVDALTLIAEQTSFSVNVQLGNTTGSDANLVGWIDFDGNGSFDPDEGAVAVVSDGATDAVLTWSNIGTGGPNIVIGETFARFRLTTDAIDGNNPGGSASDGEVEDYPALILPNRAPVARSTGPYTTDLFAGVTLDGNASYDPDEAVGDYVIATLPLECRRWSRDKERIDTAAQRPRCKRIGNRHTYRRADGDRHVWRVECK